ncbi:hypothetical protein HID58_012255, partial [Brassica napus]
SQLTTGISPVAVYFNDISPRPDESQLRFQVIHPFSRLLRLNVALCLYLRNLMLLDEYFWKSDPFAPNAPDGIYEKCAILQITKVVRSGNHSKDPQYHSLDHFFDSQPLNVDPKNISDSLQRLHLDPTWVVGSMRLNSYIYMKFMVGFSANAKAANVYKKKAESPTKTWIQHGIVTGISFTDSVFVLFISYVASLPMIQWWVKEDFSYQAENSREW